MIKMQSDLQTKLNELRIKARLGIKVSKASKARINLGIIDDSEIANIRAIPMKGRYDRSFQVGR